MTAHHRAAGAAHASACTANLLAWGREISAERSASLPTRIRACRTLIQHSPDAAERSRARDLLFQLEDMRDE